MHIDLKLNHNEAYDTMTSLLRCVSRMEQNLAGELDAKEDIGSEAVDQRVAALMAHKRENDGFWPAHNARERFAQAHDRANYLTSQQYEVFLKLVLDAPSSEARLIVHGPPSCGKTFMLVKAAAHYAMQDTGPGQEGSHPRRTLLLSHSPLLQQHTTKEVAAALQQHSGSSWLSAVHDLCPGVSVIQLQSATDLKANQSTGLQENCPSVWVMTIDALLGVLRLLQLLASGSEPVCRRLLATCHGEQPDEDTKTSWNALVQGLRGVTPPPRGQDLCVRYRVGRCVSIIPRQGRHRTECQKAVSSSRLL
jgi:hypothetical protein